MKKSVIYLLLLTGFMACESNTDPLTEQEKEQEKEQQEQAANERTDIILTDTEKQITADNNVFAFDFLRAVRENAKPDENILLSPLSASLAFAMLNNGAAGDTRSEIQGTLGYGGISIDAMNGYFQKMLAAMAEVDNTSAFEWANSIWIAEGFPVLKPFADVNKEHYDAEVRNEDFTDSGGTAKKINDWCAEKTHDKIPSIIGEVRSDAVMYLINALYFKAEWSEPFDPDITRDGTFRNSDGSTSTVSMMHAQEGFNYYDGEQYAMAEFPYGNEAFSMVVVLPHEDVAVSSVVGNMKAEDWDKASGKMVKQTINVRFPRFKVQSDRALNDDLQAMGMASMFDPAKADFSLISPNPIFVSLVKQKASIEVNEKGTEAAAVTIIHMVGSSGGPEPPKPEFYMDRPFLYFIKEKSTGTIFFMGVMNKPDYYSVEVPSDNGTSWNK